MPDLTPKQEAFVAEYLIDLNATQAATRAGYSAKTANEQGSRLLANVNVSQAVQQAMGMEKTWNDYSGHLMLGAACALSALIIVRMIQGIKLEKQLKAGK